jgi:hypothetical protein
MFKAEIIETEGTTYMIYYKDNDGTETADTIINWEFEPNALKTEYRTAIQVLDKKACDNLITYLKKIK